MDIFCANRIFSGRSLASLGDRFFANVGHSCGAGNFKIDYDFGPIGVGVQLCVPFVDAQRQPGRDSWDTR